jgi:hypothetical protein
MKKKLFTTILAGAIAVAAVLPMAVQAGRGGAGPMAGTSGRGTGTQDRLRDGSCTTSTTTQTGTGTRAGKVYGPGDGTGNLATGGTRPLNGTGYGAPSK